MSDRSIGRIRKKTLDTARKWCYALADKSDDREKYRPTSAQRARHLV